MSYFEKYQKYKSKYESLKIEMNQMIGGHGIIPNPMYKNDKNEELRCISHQMGQDMLNKCNKPKEHKLFIFLYKFDYLKDNIPNIIRPI